MFESSSSEILDIWSNILDIRLCGSSMCYDDI